MEHEIIRMNVDLKMEKQDVERMKIFLEKTGRKIGPFLRQYVLDTLKDYEGTSTEDQASELRRIMGSKA